MFVIKPDPYLLPSYRISPFRTSDIVDNNQLPNDNYIDAYFDKRFLGKSFAYFYNGREAINKALSYYQLKKDDVVTILTTSHNFYISSCVTGEIEKFCTWSREITVRTKIIFVNHEFGFPYDHIADIKKYNLPIIEDCAHSFFSQDNNATIGNTGDFVIYSFPKMFPIQIGGLLRSNLNDKLDRDAFLNQESLNYCKNVLSHHIRYEEEFKEKRIKNYSYLNHKLQELDCQPFFELKNGEIPGTFIFRLNKHQINLPDFKIYMNNHGIQSSVFYGEQAYFIPCHQNLSTDDLDYFTAVIKSFIK